MLVDVVGDGQISSSTLRKTPRRIRLSVMSRNQRSTMFSQELLVE